MCGRASRSTSDDAINSHAHAVDVLQVEARTSERRPDAAVVEEQIKIRLQGSPFIVAMRTPDADRELAAGFLLSERIIVGADDLGAIRHFTNVDAGVEGNVLDVTFVGAARDRVALVGLVIAHVYFAVRPEKWWITKSMILGWITRRQYLEHHDPDRWDVAERGDAQV